MHDSEDNQYRRAYTGWRKREAQEKKNAPVNVEFTGALDCKF